ncbi:hypothetical protein GCK32_007649 [Trichostrongylus colubriformis]|uniref:Uncharacterized protein n=1 Tax=Trichostrongylus colubriformis TaxID=6319 RepID=A0AAN8IX00_TRICO
MVPSPRKTRTSPRKKAWASPPKAVGKSFSSIFSDTDFSPLNSSWAEITANDESLNSSILENISKSESRRGRKASVPKKANSKPKFVRSLDLTQEVFGGGRRSERIKEKVDVVVVEKRTTHVDETSLRSRETRKRHLSTASSATLNEDCEGCSPIKRAPPTSGSMSSGRPARKNLKSSTPTRSPFRSRWAIENPLLFYNTGKSYKQQ